MATNTASGSKVFLGSIPHHVTEEQLRHEAEKYGKITELFYMPDKTQQNRGWAFASYESRDDAIKAINGLDAKFRFPGDDRPIEARFANQKITSLNNTMFQSKVPPRPPCCWQQFFSAEGHPYYYNTITCQTQWERPPELDMVGGGVGGLAGHFDQNPGGARPAGKSNFGPPGSNLFLFHLPSDWNDVDLIQHFQHFGSILSARIQRDREGRNRGFGFISFDNIQAATNAIRGMNGFCVCGKFLKVQLKKGEEQYNPAATAPPQTHCGASMGGAGAGFLGIHSHNNPSIRYTPY